MKERLDKLVFERGLSGSRERAKALIMEGKILVDGMPVTKAGTLVKKEAEIILKGEDIPYVSRGGLKIEAAVKYFDIRFKGKTTMDVGASTGGFTDFMLKAGASKVYCVDVGYGQLDWKLRNDPRVVLLEKTNIRYLDRESVKDNIDIATVDVSFISLTKVMPKVLEFMDEDIQILALIKPQFEAGRKDVGKGGIVRSEDARKSAVDSVIVSLEGLGLRTVGIIESPIRGQKGNIEYFIYLKGE